MGAKLSDGCSCLDCSHNKKRTITQKRLEIDVFKPFWCRFVYKMFNAVVPLFIYIQVLGVRYGYEDAGIDIVIAPV